MSTCSSQPSVCSEPLLFSFNDLGSRQVIADFSAGYLEQRWGDVVVDPRFLSVVKAGKVDYGVAPADETAQHCDTGAVSEVELPSSIGKILRVKSAFLTSSR